MMHPRLSLGEFGLTWRGEDYLFSPSFLAMSRIGNPSQIVDTLRILTTGLNDRIAYNHALHVLQSCCSRMLPYQLIGGWMWSDRQGRAMLYKGEMDFDDAITLAAHLMINGVIGRPGKRAKKDTRPLAEWDATEWHGAAVGMLEISPDVAWHMTMIEFQRAIDAKYPDTKSANVPSKAEYDVVMGAADAAIERARKKRDG